jgi:hypothetical protein
MPAKRALKGLMARNVVRSPWISMRACRVITLVSTDNLAMGSGASAAASQTTGTGNRVQSRRWRTHHKAAQVTLTSHPWWRPLTSCNLSDSPLVRYAESAIARLISGPSVTRALPAAVYRSPVYRSAQQLFPDGEPVLQQVATELSDGHPVDPGATFVGLHPP